MNFHSQLPITRKFIESFGDSKRYHAIRYNGTHAYSNSTTTVGK